MGNENEKQCDQKKEYEEKKEYLMGYLRACRRIDNLNDQLRSLQEVEQSAKTQRLSDMPKGGTGQQDLSALMARLEDLRIKIDAALIESFKIKTEIEEALWKVENAEEAKVLRLRYIYFMKWEEIAKNMNYDRSHIHRIHKNAVKNFKMRRNETF